MEKQEYVRDYIWSYNGVCFNRFFYRSFYKIALDKLVKIVYKYNNNKEDKYPQSFKQRCKRR